MNTTTSSPDPWKICLGRLEEELPAQQFNTWIRPLQARPESGVLRLLAPNRFVVDWVRERYLTRLTELVDQHAPGMAVSLEVGTQSAPAAAAPVVRAAAIMRESRSIAS